MSQLLPQLFYVLAVYHFHMDLSLFFPPLTVCHVTQTMTFYVVLEFLLLKLAGGIDLLPGLSGWLLSKVSVSRFKLMGMKMVLSTTHSNYNS